MTPKLAPHIFGIRHHGPGSARSLRRALEALQPDVVLVEGPPDAHEVLPLLIDPQMQPPAAILVYVPEQPRRAVYYPFAIFSPEWQAIHYALTNAVPVRFMDLPQAHQLAMEEDPLFHHAASPLEADPLRWLAEAAGYSDSERWWDHMVEQRRGEAAPDDDLFAAILQAMTALRSEVAEAVAAEAVEATASANGGPADAEESGARAGETSEEDTARGDAAAGTGPSSEAELPSPDVAAAVPAAPEQHRLHEERREAYMRQTIRTAQREGFERIAVVCGAWHAPALVDLPPAKTDAALLKDLPKTRVQATWVPWTHGRLSFQSGYGAGVEAPGWYHHLWTSPDRVITRWMTRVAGLLRAEDLDASPAHVIEAVRLSEALAALRERPLPGLPELNEAIQTVFCFGSEVPLRLIREKLMVGETLGQVPEATPMVPLQQDLLREQKRLRLPAEATLRTLDLDLRQPNDLQRSHLLHRLNLLRVPWGQSERVHGKSGTFHEVWRLQWQPELSVSLIEAGIWGNTLLDAATAAVREAVGSGSGAPGAVAASAPAPDLPAITALLDRALLADLPDAIAAVMAHLEAAAALASDVAHLMEALPPLANVLRYGNVRRTDTAMVAHVVDGLVARICIGLPNACSSLNDEAAAAMFDRLLKVAGAVALLQSTEHQQAWDGVLRQLAVQRGLHGLLAGRCCRLLLDAGSFTSGETARLMGLALSTATEPAQAAAWVEGFLKGSGILLLHDETLWAVLDGWVSQLSGDGFTALLPLLRRTFAGFAAPERRQMGERVSRGPAQRTTGTGATTEDFDPERAAAVLPLVARLLGLAPPVANGGSSAALDA